MSSQINPNNIDGNYPVAGQDNNSQGFRDNFTNTKINFQYAENEINDLQNKVLLKSSLAGESLDNNMNDNLIYSALIRDFSEVKVAHPGSSGTVDLDFAAAPYHTISTSGSVTLSFSNFPVSGQYGYMKVQMYINNASHTLTLPAAVSQGLSGIQGISPGTSGVTNTITFNATGYYEFGFGTYDAGSTITLFDLNRALTNFDSADIVTDDLTATGRISAVGNVIGGNILTGGYVNSTGNVTGGNIISPGIVSADGTITGGNVVTGGIISADGTITGGNLATGGTISAGGTVTGTTINAGTIYLVGSLPTATSGQRAFVSDADSVTFGNSAVGGASNIVPVWSASGSWYIG